MYTRIADELIQKAQYEHSEHIWLYGSQAYCDRLLCRVFWSTADAICVVPRTHCGVALEILLVITHSRESRHVACRRCTQDGVLLDIAYQQVRSTFLGDCDAQACCIHSALSLQPIAAACNLLPWRFHRVFAVKLLSKACACAHAVASFT